jgi:hypothetical protein
VRLDSLAVSLQRGIDGGEPVRPDPVGRMSGTGEIRRVTTSTRLATGTLACPVCDAPVAPAGVLGPAAGIACPFCSHRGAVRDFLSLAAPSRPARVAVRVVRRARRAVR